MIYFYSVLSRDELADIPKGERHNYVGIISDGKILQPARCYECGSEVVVLEEDTTRSQCTDCGILNDVYFYDSYSPVLAKEIPAGFDGVTFRKDIMV